MVEKTPFNHTPINVEHVAHKKIKPNLTPVLLLVAQIAVFSLLALLIIQHQTTPPKKKITNIETPSPTPTTVSRSAPDPQVNSTRQFTYLKNNNVYQFTERDGIEKQLTLDGGKTIRYRSIKWVNPSIVSYEKCTFSEADPNNQYKCALLTQSTIKPINEELAHYFSYKLEDGTQHGGDILAFSWNKKRTAVAYLSLQQTNTRNVVAVHYLNPDTKEDTVYDYFTESKGHGDAVDQDIRVEFSPSGNLFLVEYTPLYPESIQTNEDHGTLFVYEAATGKKVYEASKQFATNALFLTDDKITFKKYDILPDSSHSSASLVLFSLVTGAKTELLKNASGTFSYVQSEGNVYFAAPNPTKGMGITLFMYDINAKKISAVQDNVIPKSAGTNSQFIVKTMKKCSPDQTSPDFCQVDLFNGYAEDSYAVLDIQKSTLKALPFITNPVGISIEDTIE